MPQPKQPATERSKFTPEFTPEHRAKISAKAKARWSDPAWLMQLAQRRLAEQQGQQS